MLDYSAYLLLLAQFEDIKAQDSEFAEDMKDDVANYLLDEAKKRSIDYREAAQTAVKFYPLAFDDNSPWKAMVEEPFFVKALKEAQKDN